MDLKTIFIQSGFSPERVAVDFAIDPRFIWMGLAAVALVYTIVSLVLVYHWLTYGSNPLTIGFAAALYAAGSIAIFSILLVTTLSITATT